MATGNITIAVKLEGVQNAAQQLDQLKNKITKGLNFGKVALGITAVSQGLNILRQGLAAANRIMNTTIERYAQFDKGLANVSTLLGDQANKYLPQYRRELIALSSKYGEAVENLTKPLYDVISASVEPAKAMQLLDVAAKGAKVGIADLGTAVDTYTTSINAWHLAVDQAAKVADIWQMTIKRGKTTLGEIGQNLAKVAPLAAALNVPIEQIAAGLATLTKQGVPTAIAFTQLAAIFRGLVRHEKDAARHFPKLAPIFNKQALASMGLQKWLTKLYEATGGNVNILVKLFGRAEAINAVLAMTGKNAKMAAEDLAAMQNATGELERGFENVKKSFSFRWDQLKTKFQNIALVLGESLAPAALAVGNVVAKILQLVNPLLRLLGKMPLGIQVLTAAVIGLVAAQSKWAWASKLARLNVISLSKAAIQQTRAFYKLSFSVANINRKLPTLQRLLGGTTKASRILSGVFQAGLAPAIAFATTEVIRAIDAFKEMRKAHKELMESLSSMSDLQLAQTMVASLEIARKEIAETGKVSKETRKQFKLLVKAGKIDKSVLDALDDAVQLNKEWTFWQLRLADAVKKWREEHKKSKGKEPAPDKDFKDLNKLLDELLNKTKDTGEAISELPAKFKPLHDALHKYNIDVSQLLERMEKGVKLKISYEIPEIPIDEADIEEKQEQMPKLTVKTDFSVEGITEEDAARIKGALNSVQYAFADTFADIMTGTMSLKKAFHSLGYSIQKAFVQLAAQSVARSIFAQLHSILTAAGGYIVQAGAKLIQWFVGTMGPLGIPAAAASIAGIIALFNQLKHAVGFAEGGLWTGGPAYIVPVTPGAPIGMISERGEPEYIVPASKAQASTVIIENHYHISGAVIDKQAFEGFVDDINYIQRRENFLRRG